MSLKGIDEIFIIAYFFSKYREDAEDSVGYSIDELTSIFRIELKWICDEFSPCFKENYSINDENIRDKIKQSFEALKGIEFETLSSKVLEIVECKVNEQDDLNEIQDDINSEYNPKNLKIDPSYFSIYELYRKKKKRLLDLCPTFQRSSVWKVEQKSELIESVIMGLPLPVFYFSKVSNEMKVVDGKQRLSALFDFMDNDYKLKGLKLLGSLNGKKFSDLSDVTKTLIEDYQLHTNVIVPPTPDRVMFNIFDRVNRCGTKLNRQELRNALYPGPGMDMIKRIAKSEEMKNVTGGASKKDNRMKLEYLISRFIAFYFVNSKELSYTNSDVDELLKNMYIKLNGFDDSQLKKMENMVKGALKNNMFYIGKTAFIKPDFDEEGNYILQEKNVSMSNINMNIFETFMMLMSDFPFGLTEIKEKVFDIVVKNFYTSEFIESIGNRRDSVNKVEWRLELINNTKEKMLNVGKN